MNGRLMKWGQLMEATVFVAVRMAAKRAAKNGTTRQKMTTGTARVISVVLTVGLTAALTVSCKSPEEHCLNAVHNAVYQNDFQRGLEVVDRFYAEHTEAGEQPSETVMAQRWEISVYARLCLLMTGELNRRFLAYYRVREMGAMVPWPLPFVSRHHYAYLCMYYEMGLYGPALSLLLSLTEENGWDKKTTQLMFDIFTKTHQWRPAQTYWLAFKQNWRTRRWVKPYDEILSQKIIDSIDGTRVQPTDDRYLFGPQYGGGFIDGYVKALFNRELGQANLNPYLTDYYTLIVLLEKDLSQVPTLIKVYRSQNRPLPDYLQEAVLMYASSPENADALETDGLTHESLQLDKNIEQRVDRVLRDFEMLKIGSLPFDEMTKRHAASYTYHLLFGQIQ